MQIYHLSIYLSIFYVTSLVFVVFQTEHIRSTEIYIKDLFCMTLSSCRYYNNNNVVNWSDTGQGFINVYWRFSMLTFFSSFIKYIGLQNLIQRNEQLYGSGNAPSGGVALPFILVQVQRLPSNAAFTHSLCLRWFIGFSKQQLLGLHMWTWEDVQQ